MENTFNELKEQFKTFESDSPEKKIQQLGNIIEYQDALMGEHIKTMEDQSNLIDRLIKKNEEQQIQIESLSKYITKVTPKKN